MVKDSTLYERLEIPTDASESQIKKAFNALSKKWHPDKNEDDMKAEADKKFKSIVEAKDILIDAEKRRLYDQIGMDIFSQPQNPFPNFNFNFNPFANFGFQTGFHLRPIQLSINVTLEQVYRQENVSVTYNCQTNCKKCEGEGGQTETCNLCKGNGKVVNVQKMGNMMTQSIRDCHECQGRGKRVHTRCDCKDGIVEEKRTVNFSLASSITSGYQINIKGQGNQHRQYVSDLNLTIQILPHPVFKQENNNLLMNVELTLYEALFGFSKTITHIDGNPIQIESSTTNYNSVKCIPNKGMNSQGNLYIIYTFGLPTLDPEYKDIFKDMLPHTIEKHKVDKDVIISYLNKIEK